MSFKQFIIASVIGVALAFVTGCAASPLAPKSFTCKTQAREYVLPSGVSQLEIDTYVQDTPCPLTPIATVVR